MDLEGKVALVTGGAARVGRAITLGLAGAGAHVVVHYLRSVEAAQETVALAQELGVEALGAQADFSDPVDVQHVLEMADEHFGRVDVLVHAASPFIPNNLFDVTIDTWRHVMGVLVESFLLLAQGLAPGMVERGEGAMLAILDRGAYDPWPGFLAHGVGKSALWALARSLAVELAPQVRVNGIVPGLILPPARHTLEQQERLAASTLMGRWGDPQDVVDAVLYLLRSDYVTGEVLFVDGGERWSHRRR
jgi:3-oxoacyl-[acyl-carrier protein] reductase/pteridine reductase